MARIALIGGTGASLFPCPDQVDILPAESGWGEASAPLLVWQQGRHEIFYLRRHGESGRIPPHCVNYRANIQVLKDLAADAVIALNAVGGIAQWAAPGTLAIPEQLIDYTWGREHTFFDGHQENIEFIDFTKPYNDKLRNNLASAAAASGLQIAGTGTYGVTQGPRLETSAEINRMERDGCDLVGMTAMPEAALARELDLSYASCCIVVNWAAGRAGGDIHQQIESHLAGGMQQVAILLEAFLQAADS